MKTTSNNFLGISFLVVAVFTFSLQDVAVRLVGGNYPVLEIVIFRSLVALPGTLLLFYLEGNRGLPKTDRHGLEYLRGVYLFLSFTTYMMSLAALTLADIAAIRNSGPLMITLLSVLFLGERVGLRHWTALLLGFLGVLLIVRPGSATFNWGSVFILLSTLFYALTVMLTRQLRSADSSATMAYYSSLVYIVASFLLLPLSLFVGETPNAHPSIAFLFRAWTMPSVLDFIVMSGLGLLWATGMYFMARAYSVAQASVVAPFEYVALPISVLWGLMLWAEIPSWATWIGAMLTVLSGLYIFYQNQRRPLAKTG
jgi:drug/metabolite transporter (DMT)-like permease